MGEGLNRVILLGHIGATPELRHTATGTPLLNLRVATSESYVDRAKEVQQRTDWHTVTVWGARAEALSKFLAKGACVLIEGGLRTSSYEKDGVMRYRTEILAREVCLTARRPQATPLLDDEPAVAEVTELTEDEVTTVAPKVKPNGARRAAPAPAAMESLPF